MERLASEVHPASRSATAGKTKGQRLPKRCILFVTCSRPIDGIDGIATTCFA